MTARDICPTVSRCSTPPIGKGTTFGRGRRTKGPRLAVLGISVVLFSGSIIYLLHQTTTEPWLP